MSSAHSDLSQSSTSERSSSSSVRSLTSKSRSMSATSVLSFRTTENSLAPAEELSLFAKAFGRRALKSGVVSASTAKPLTKDDLLHDHSNLTKFLDSIRSQHESLTRKMARDPDFSKYVRNGQSVQPIIEMLRYMVPLLNRDSEANKKLASKLEGKLDKAAVFGIAERLKDLIVNARYYQRILKQVKQDMQHWVMPE